MNSTEFAIAYGPQIRLSRMILNQLREMIGKNMIPETVNAEEVGRLEKTYDKKVIQFIDYAINGNSYTCDEDVVRCAINNYNSTGTEPQFTLFAIGEMYQKILNRTNLQSMNLGNP